MGKNKWVRILLAIMVVLLATACSNNGQPAASSGQPDNGSALEPISYAKLYQRSVFLGDSITEGLSYHDVLEEENVIAGAGKTAQIALETGNVDEIVSQKPEHVYIQLGSDDILWPTDNPQEYSLSHYAQLIDKIKAELPKTKITLLSVTPVTAEVEKLEPRYRNIADYNEGLKELAAEKQVGYIDLSPLVAEHADQYDTDGIHFQESYYPLLLDYLKATLDVQQSAK